MTYDVRRVVLGGGVAGAGDTFLAPVLRALDELRSAIGARPRGPAPRCRPSAAPRRRMPAAGAL